MTIAIFIVVLTLVAGLVAAAGDRMGQLAAKRKIRIGKLRPRDASRLVAVLTGMAISIVTFGVVFAVWSDFREALTRYSETKSNLASVLAERDSMLKDIKEAEAGRDDAIKAQTEAEQAMQDAEELTTAAQNKLIALEDQLSVADLQIKDKEAELAKRQAEIDKIQKELGAARQSLKDIEKQKEGDQLQLKSLQELKERARQEILKLQDDAERLKGSEVELEIGKVLSYQEIPAGTEDISARLQEGIDRLQINLLRRGFEIDTESVAAANRLAASMELGQYGTVVVIRNGRNVFADDEDKQVLLDFSAQPLAPIVRRGSDFMTITVSEQGSSVRVMGREQVVLTLGNQVDIDFSQRLDTLFQTEARNAGFLPDITTATYSHPLNELLFQAEKINSRQRPFVIHLRAQKDLTAIDGVANLADLEISVSGVSE
ncbi:DUF3084 domain-containing protein [bacterium]|nr:DUF3084 domain-containing protein [bacterium]